MVTRSSIWSCRQNKPSYVVQDIMRDILLTFGAMPSMQYKSVRNHVYEILLQRGIFKWLAVRRDLIKLKNEWKAEITARQTEIASNKVAIRMCKGTAPARHAAFRNQYHRGYMAAMTRCRQEVRAMCHSDRWQVQDNDRDAQRWLEEREAHCE
jgi:uncharacterized glyoxalase superfamily metalloenzyme YdcJ